MIIATTDRKTFDPAAFKQAIESVGTDVSVCIGGSETMAFFLRSTLGAWLLNNAIAEKRVPGLLYFVVLELGKSWFAAERLPASKWLVRFVGARN